METILSQAPRFFSPANILFFAEACLNTLALAFASCVIGFALGLLIASVRLTRTPYLLPARMLGIAIAEIFRRVPPLIVLFLVFFGFSLSHVDMPPFVEALIALSVIATAFMSEIIRTGFEAIALAQWEAARTMNFTLAQTLRLVVLPQALKVIVPTASLFCVLFLKDTALASQIGVTELTFVGKSFIDRGFSPVLSLGTALILYFLMSYPLARAGQWLEKRLASS